MGQDDHSQSIGEGWGLPFQLVEALLLLCQGNFSYRLPRTLLRDNDDTVAFFFNAIAEELERMIQQSRENETRMSMLIERVSEALVSLASGEFSVQIERDFRGVHGEFLLRPLLAFGIAHDSASASDTISNLRSWILCFRLECDLSTQRERGICCSNP